MTKKKNNSFDDLLDVSEEELNEEQTSVKTDATNLTEEAPVISIATGSKARQQSKTKHVTYKFVDPSRCKPWPYHDRHESWYTKERCRDLIEDFQAGKEQLEAGIVRKIDNDPDYDYEVIAGMRRRYSTEYAGIEYKVIVREMTDQEAALVMTSENRYQNVSTLEHGLNYLKMFNDGLFDSKNAMAKELGYSKTQFHRMLKCAELIQLPQVFAFIKDLPKLTISLVESLYKLLDSNSDLFHSISKQVFEKNKTDEESQVFDNKYLKRIQAELIKETEGSFEPVPKKKVKIAEDQSLTISMNKKGVVSIQFDINNPPEFTGKYLAQNLLDEIKGYIS